MKPQYRLENADERAREHPRTFLIPPLEARERLRVGDKALLLFHPSEGVGGERMWVQITECLATIPRRYSGKLVSAPATIRVEHGARVDFGSEHVLDVYNENGFHPGAA